MVSSTGIHTHTDDGPFGLNHVSLYAVNTKKNALQRILLTIFLQADFC